MENQDSILVVWQEILAGVFSVLGRMACLAHCYDPRTHCYTHDKVAERLGIDETDGALRRAHKLVWTDWMRGSLTEQQSDVCLLLSNGSKEITQAVATWRTLRPFLKFVPPSAELIERTLFISNLEIVLDLLHNQHCYNNRTEHRSQTIEQTALANSKLLILTRIQRDTGNPAEASQRGHARQVRFQGR